MIIGKRGITPVMAMKLSRYFGTTPQLWLNLQNSYDLYRIGRKKAQEIEVIKRYEVA